MITHVNGIDLYWERTGEGRPVILLHGNGEDHTIFDEAAALLSNDFTCICPDSRGHGQSSPADVLHYDDMASDMIGLMESLDLHDVLFYGFSDGGIVGLLSAARCDRISTLIASGANLSPKGVRLRLRLLLRLMYLVRKDPKIALMLREPDIGDDLLRSIRADTLVLAGSRDLIVEAETRRIAGTIPGARLRILPGEGHGTYIIHQTAIGEIIRDFAAACAST